MTKNDLDALVASIVPAGQWDTRIVPVRARWTSGEVVQLPLVAVLLPGLKRRPQVLRRLRRALRRSLPVGTCARLWLQSRRGPVTGNRGERVVGAVQ